LQHFSRLITGLVCFALIGVKLLKLLRFFPRCTDTCAEMWVQIQISNPKSNPTDGDKRRHSLRLKTEN